MPLWNVQTNPSPPSISAVIIITTLYNCLRDSVVFMGQKVTYMIVCWSFPLCLHGPFFIMLINLLPRDWCYLYICRRLIFQVCEVDFPYMTLLQIPHLLGQWLMFTVWRLYSFISQATGKTYRFSDWIFLHFSL